MLNIKFLKDLILYIVSLIFWIPLRLASVVLQGINYICLCIIKHRWMIIGILICLFFLEVPNESGVAFSKGNTMLNISLLVNYYQTLYEKGIVGLGLLVVILVLAYALSKIITLLFGVLVLPITTGIHNFLVSISRDLMKSRLVNLDKDFMAIKNDGLYNIESFKKQFMYE